MRGKRPELDPLNLSKLLGLPSSSRETAYGSLGEKMRRAGFPFWTWRGGWFSMNLETFFSKYPKNHEMLRSLVFVLRSCWVLWIMKENDRQRKTPCFFSLHFLLGILDKPHVFGNTNGIWTTLRWKTGWWGWWRTYIHWTLWHLNLEMSIHLF